MNKSEIVLLYQYNNWANERILNAAANITQEQFLAPSTYPYGGLRGTLTHTLFAEWIWRRRLQGESPVNRFKPEDFPTFESLRSRWHQEEEAMLDFVGSLSEPALNNTFQYKDTKGTTYENVLWQVMVHVVNHGTQHRSEAAAMLTDLGHSPGDIDLIVFLREHK
jgi:uncharacterized damage-inducible protein DinB